MGTVLPMELRRFVWTYHTGPWPGGTVLGVLLARIPRSWCRFLTTRPIPRSFAHVGPWPFLQSQSVRNSCRASSCSAHTRRCSRGSLRAPLEAKDRRPARSLRRSFRSRRGHKLRPWQQENRWARGGAEAAPEDEITPGGETAPGEETTAGNETTRGGLRPPGLRDLMDHMLGYAPHDKLLPFPHRNRLVAFGLRHEHGPPLAHLVPLYR